MLFYQTWWRWRCSWESSWKAGRFCHYFLSGKLPAGDYFPDYCSPRVLAWCQLTSEGLPRVWASPVRIMETGLQTGQITHGKLHLLSLLTACQTNIVANVSECFIASYHNGHGPTCLQCLKFDYICFEVFPCVFIVTSASHLNDTSHTGGCPWSSMMSLMWDVSLTMPTQ